ncbi:MAG: hypothetical protein PHU61_03015 [Candidatus Absconditabacteria bacterium]|nr:hypothetical protein [Candidatus Absconditabacteria bacterium]MDD3868248.1 hypothetical protein [Candidatus Absconditabacteria bacterium]MDD4714624.1 hypothetical protein [Candidatus Absconditabacteria bacterium]
MKKIQKKFLNNCIKLVIGLFLLGMSYFYLQAHPAEQISFFSGFKVIFQNTEIFFQNLFGDNGDLLKQKYALESYYQALISLAEEKPCADPLLVNDLHATYEKLLAEPKNTLAHTLDTYHQKQFEFDRALRIECEETFVVPETDSEMN